MRKLSISEHMSIIPVLVPLVRGGVVYHTVCSRGLGKDYLVYPIRQIYQYVCVCRVCFMWIFEGFIFFGVYWGHSALYQGPFIVLLGIIHLSVCGSYYSRTKRASWWRFRAEIKGLVHPNYNNYMWFLAMQNNLKFEFYRAALEILKTNLNL